MLDRLFRSFTSHYEIVASDSADLGSEKGKCVHKVTRLRSDGKKGMLATCKTASDFNSTFAVNSINLSLNTICLKGQAYQPNY